MALPLDTLNIGMGSHWHTNSLGMRFMRGSSLNVAFEINTVKLYTDHEMVIYNILLYTCGFTMLWLLSQITFIGMAA